MEVNFLSKIEDYFKAVWGKGRLASAYIFTGAIAELRMEAAKFLAKLTNCRYNPPPCSRCASCLKIEEEEHENVLFLKGGKKVGIDAVRSVQKFASLKAFSSGCRVAIIDNAHTLTPEAGNAFLKILEEPPAGVVIILLAPDLNNMLPTIKSRCQLIRLKASSDDLEKALASKLSLDPVRAKIAVALGLLDTGNGLSLNNRFWVKRENIFRNKTFSLQLLGQGKERRKEFSFLLLSLLYFLRDVLVVKLTQDERKIINQDLKPYVYDYSRYYNAEDILEKLSLLHEVYRERENVNINVACNLAGGLLWKK